MDETAPSAAARILDLLRRAYVERRSGDLHLDRGGERRGLALREGHIVYARSDVAGERLGDVLVRHGDVSQADLDQALATSVAGRRPVGTVLEEMGLVDEAQLEEAIACHVRAILFSALDEPGCSPTFEATGSLPEEAAAWDPASHLSTGQVLLEAARLVQDPAVVREALGDPDRKLVLATDPWLRARPVALTPTDGFVLSRVDGTLSARELVGLIPLPPEETEKSLLGLLCTGSVAFAPDRPAAAHPSLKPTPSGVPPPRPPTAPPPVPPAESTAAAAEGAHDKVPPPPSPGPSPEEVRRLILETHASLAQRDHFELLGVTPVADAVELRAGYARLARILHPDACRDAVLADVSEQREEVFHRVREAYETLRDPEERAAYEADLRRRKPRPAPVVPSPPEVSSSPASASTLEETIAAGEELIRNGQHWDAVQQVEPTLLQATGALRVRAQMALGRACLAIPGWLRRAESHFQEVLHEDPMHLEAYLLLGDLYRASELPARATGMYRKALELQPQNRHALRELARLEGAGSPTAGSASLLGFLKKR
jgi:hypothetical protein